MKAVVIIFSLLILIQSRAQDFNKGTAYVTDSVEYDRSMVTPFLQGKHSVSLGLYGAQSSPDQNIAAGGMVQVGYHFLILRKRKLLLALKDKTRTEINSFGIQLSFLNKDEHYLMGHFFHSHFGLKGRLFSFYFLSEYGLGYHYKKANGAIQ